MKISCYLLVLSVIAVVLAPFEGRIEAAIFDGSGRVEVPDPSGELSWNPTANSMTVSCWFKMSVPNCVARSKNMVIFANGRGSNTTGTHAYFIQLNISTGNVEFTARGANGELEPQSFVARPYLDCWSYVAVARSGGDFTGYINGRRQFKQSPLPQDVIAGFMFARQPVANPTLGSLLRGNYKLGGTPNPDLDNYAATPPAGTSPVTKIVGVTFEESNHAGEQSTFDSRKNGGRDAICPLSGSFSWDSHGSTRSFPARYSTASLWVPMASMLPETVAAAIHYHAQSRADDGFALEL